MDSALLQHDILDHVDFHRTWPASLNSRVTDLGSPNHALRENRLGVYLHWVLPRAYRAGRTPKAATNGSSSGSTNDQASSQVPNYLLIPNRWFVIRRLRSSDPPPSQTHIPEFQGWVVESNRVTRIDDIDAKADLEVDFAPFVQPKGNPGVAGQVQEQSEVFLGAKFPAETWRETEIPGGKDAEVRMVALLHQEVQLT